MKLCSYWYVHKNRPYAHSLANALDYHKEQGRIAPRSPDIHQPSELQKISLAFFYYELILISFCFNLVLSVDVSQQIVN